MNPFRFIRRLILWDFGRNNLPYEFVCIIYIAALVFLPTNSNGWFNDGEMVQLANDATITLHQVETTLYLTWAKGEQAPNRETLENFAEQRFGPDTAIFEAPELGARAFRIMPGGWK